MTATLTDPCHIVLQPGEDDVAAMPTGQEYHVFVASSGVITLRPKREHKLPLLEHLRGMQGLELPARRRDPLPPPIGL